MEEKSTAHHQDHTVHMHKVITHTIRERMRLNLDGQANGRDQYQNLFFPSQMQFNATSKQKPAREMIEWLILCFGREPSRGITTHGCRID